MQKRKIVSRLSATMLAGVMGTSSLLPGLSAAAATLQFDSSNRIDLKMRTDGNGSTRLYALSQGVAGESLRLGGDSNPDNIGQFVISGESRWALCLRPSVTGGIGASTSVRDTNYWKKLDPKLKSAIAKAMYYGYPVACDGKSEKAAGYYNATQMIIWEMVLGYRDWTGEMRRTRGYNLCVDVYNTPRGSYTWEAYKEINSKLINHYKTLSGMSATAKDAAKYTENTILMTYNFADGSFSGTYNMPSDASASDKKWTDNVNKALSNLAKKWSDNDYNGKDVVASYDSKTGKLTSNYKPFGNSVQTSGVIRAELKSHDYSSDWIVYAVSENNQDMVTNTVTPDPANGYLGVAIPNYGNVELIKKFENAGEANIDKATAVKYAEGVSFKLRTIDPSSKKMYYVIAHEVTSGDYAGSWQFDGTTDDESKATKIKLDTDNYTPETGFTKTYIFDLPTGTKAQNYDVIEYVDANSQLARDGYPAYGSGKTSPNFKSVRVNPYDPNDPTASPKNVTISFTNNKSDFGNIRLDKFIEDPNTGDQTTTSGKMFNFVAFVYKDGKIQYLKDLSSISLGSGRYRVPKTALNLSTGEFSGNSVLTTDINQAEQLATSSGVLEIFDVPAGYKFGFIEVKAYAAGGATVPQYGSSAELFDNKVSFSKFADQIANYDGEKDGILVVDTAISGVNQDVDAPFKRGSQYAFTFGITTIAGSEQNEDLVNIPYHVNLTVKKEDDSGKALPGATIGLYKDGELLESKKSDKNGNVAFDYNFDFEVKESDGYTYKEITPPTGYATNNTEYKISFNINPREYTSGMWGTAVASLDTIDNLPVIENYPYKGEIHLLKTETETNKPMSGITFEFTTNKALTHDQIANIKLVNGTNLKIADGDVAADGVFMTATTDANGLIDVTGLPLGTLKDGYFVNVFSAVEKNTPKGLIGGSYDFEFDLDSYDPDNNSFNSYPIVYETGEVTNSPVPVPVKVHKVDEDNTPIKGVKFSVVPEENVVINGTVIQEAGESIGILTTDENGNAQNYTIEGERQAYKYAFKVYGGFKYKFVETEHPEQYVDTEKEYSFVAPFSETGSPKEFTYTKTNEWVKGYIEVDKFDETHKTPLSGATFEVWQDTNNNGAYDEGVDVSIGNLADNGDGTYKTGKLKYGTYFVQETKAPEGYVRCDDIFTVSIATNDQTYYVGNKTEENGSVWLSEREIRGDVEVVKTDAETGERLTGAEFTLYKDANKNGVLDDGEDAYGILSEIETGVYNIRNVPYGNYVVKETKAPENFRFDNGDYPVVISADKQTVRVKNNDDNENFIDQPERASISLLKFDPEYPDNKLSGAQFEVYLDKNRNNVIDDEDEFVDNLHEGTDENAGIYTLSDLRLDQYLVIETVAPQDFDKDDNTYVAILSFDGQVYEVENEAGKGFANSPIKGDIVLNKYDADYPENKLSGAEFEVWKDMNDNGTVDDGVDVYVGIMPEVEKGQYRIDNLRVGNYLVHEVKAPEGYNLDDGYYQASITSEQREFEVTNRDDDDSFAKGFYNDAITGSVNIKKTDLTTSKGLPDTGIRLYDEDMNIIAEGRTDKNGDLVFENLRYGKYYFQEFDAPEGYVISEELFEFTIFEDGKVEQAEMTNKPIEGEVIIKKTDVSTSAPLPNTGIRIYDEEMNVVFEGRTDEKGELAITGLLYGTYYFQEFDAPKGYVLDETLHSFKITIDGKIEEAKMTNRMITGSIVITKTDVATSETLPNTGIALYREDGTLVEKLRTDEKGEVTFKNLTYGKYYFIEFDAPEGYLVNDAKHYFEITEDGKVIHDTLEDEKKPVQTGNENNMVIPVLAASASLMGLAAITVVAKIKKRED